MVIFICSKLTSYRSYSATSQLPLLVSKCSYSYIALLYGHLLPYIMKILFRINVSMMKRREGSFLRPVYSLWLHSITAHYDKVKTKNIPRNHAVGELMNDTVLLVNCSLALCSNKQSRRKSSLNRSSTDRTCCLSCWIVSAYVQF